MGRAVSKSFSPSVIIPGGAVMENKYVSFDDAVIRDALLTAVNRITLMDEKSGEFEAGDGNQNMVTFEVSE